MIVDGPMAPFIPIGADAIKHIIDAIEDPKRKAERERELLRQQAERRAEEERQRAEKERQDREALEQYMRDL